MKKLKISSKFTVGDIHNLRVHVGKYYRSISKAEAKKDFNIYYEKAKKEMAKFS
ncbi:MAG: hypothetical protein LBU55_04805 [Elusimicrobiota bacterium]|jgi:hypothetical protein|nr:hypothetical protein [Elusimicrobiota bacterium]